MFGLIFLIILSIILYAVSKILIAPFMSLRQYCLFIFSQCGFFRRKQQVKKKDGDEVQNEDFEAFEKNPFNQAKLTAVTRISDGETTQVDLPIDN